MRLAGSPALSLKQSTNCSVFLHGFPRPMPPSTPIHRSPRGKDDVFCFARSLNGEMYVAHSVISKRHTPESLRNVFGSTCIQDMIFVANRNLHQVKPGNYGTLCWVSASKSYIGVFVKHYGGRSAILQLFPPLPVPQVHFVNTWSTKGFYLQQVLGEVSLSHYFNDNLIMPALSIDRHGHISMSPEGPDIIQKSLLHFVPEDEAQEANVDGQTFCFQQGVSEGERKPTGHVPVVYVRDSKTRLGTPSNQNTFLVPLPTTLAEIPSEKCILKNMYVKSLYRASRMSIVSLYVVPPFRKIYSMNYAKLDKTSLLKLRSCDLSPTDFQIKARGLALEVIQLMTFRLPPDESAILRCKVVSPDEFHLLKLSASRKQCRKTKQSKRRALLVLNDDEFVLGYERCDLEHPSNIGIMVSCWARSRLASTPQLTKSFGLGMASCYGLGFGQRPCSHHLGINAYRGERISTRPFPSPTVSSEDIALHQYRNGQMDSFLLQPLVEKTLSLMVSKVVTLARRLNPSLMDLSLDGCTMKIATCGVSTVAKEGETSQSNHGYFCFCNTSHIDIRDSFPELERQSILRHQCLKPYLRQLLQFDGFCLPTTCGHQFLGSEEDNCVSFMVFAMNSIGCAVFLDNGVAHNFMGRSFYHQTCVGVVVGAGGLTTIANRSEKNVLSFSWGSSGNDLRRRTSVKRSLRKFLTRRLRETGHIADLQLILDAIELGLGWLDDGTVIAENWGLRGLQEFVWSMLATQLPDVPSGTNEISDASAMSGNLAADVASTLPIQQLYTH